MFRLYKNRKLLGIFNSVDSAKAVMFEEEACDEEDAERQGLYVIRRWWPLENSRHGCTIELIDDTDENDLKVFVIQYVIAKVKAKR